MKIIYYYQTLIGLDSILDEQIITCSHIILSAFHFGINLDGTPYIHLNDHIPTDPLFQKCWDDLKILSNRGVTVMIMLGGAGGAYETLFSNYTVYYNLLKDIIQKYDFIKGIDLDIEEYVDIDNIRMLIHDITLDFGTKFIITMAPLGTSLQYDESGMGGFIYKQLFNTYEGQFINWFNCQCYNSYTVEDVDKMVDNGYPNNKIVMGMISSQFPTNRSFYKKLDVIEQIKDKYPNIGGVDIWEYSDSPPGHNINPVLWSKFMYYL
jgi:chitinase